MTEKPNFSHLAEELAKLWEGSMEQLRGELRIPGFLEDLVVQQGERLQALSERIDSLEREMLHARIQAAEDALAAKKAERHRAAAAEARIAGLERRLQELSDR
jgi:hypothetical protein